MRPSVSHLAVNPLSLPNNAASWWFRDAGMRALAWPIIVGFASTISSGYDGSCMTGLQANKRYFMPAIGDPDANKLGLIVAAYTLGALPALMPASYMADRWGRRASLAVGCVVIIAGALVQALTTGGWCMFAGRFIVGLGGMVASISGTPYAAEVAHPRNRAQVGALTNTSWYIGSIIAAWTSFGTSSWDNSWSWRLVCLMQVAPPAFQLISLPFLPESPRWLVSKGRYDEAHAVLARYHANGDLHDPLVLFELGEIKEAIEAEKAATEGVGYSAFLKTRGNRHRLGILIMVGLFSQWVGNGIISYYLVSILESVGITSEAQQQGYNGGLQIYNWILAIAGSLSCERFGRRKLWLISATGMFFSFVVIMACSAAYEAGKHAAGPAVLAFLFVYFGFYDIAFTGLTLGYPLEILPYSLRTRGLAILQFCITVALCFNQYVNPIALEAIAWKYYGMYIVIQVIAVACIYFFFPETKGLLLEEVATVFDGDKAVLTIQHDGVLPKDDKKDGGDVHHVEVLDGGEYGDARV